MTMMMMLLLLMMMMIRLKGGKTGKTLARGGPLGRV